MKRFFRQLICWHDGWSQNPLYAQKAGLTFQEMSRLGVRQWTFNPKSNIYFCAKCGALRNFGFRQVGYLALPVSPMNLNDPEFYVRHK